jgi:hypothetical protein
MIDHTTECQWNDINHMHLGKNKSTLIPKDIMYSKKGVHATLTLTPTRFQAETRTRLSPTQAFSKRKTGVTKSN